MFKVRGREVGQGGGEGSKAQAVRRAHWQRTHRHPHCAVCTARAPLPRTCEWLMMMRHFL